MFSSSVFSYVRVALRGLILLIAFPSVSFAANPVEWHIVEEIRRTDTTKTWNSPTAIDLNKMVWEYSYEITKVTGTVNVPFLGLVTEDITSSIPEEDRTGAGETRNLPAVLIDDTIVEPETGTSAHVFVEVDDLGFGRGVFSDIMLGSVTVPIFGSRPIERINIEAVINVSAYDYGDFNRDGQIDAADYVAWRNDDSAPTGYEWWRSNFGKPSTTSGAGGLNNAGSVPEPASALLLAFACSTWYRVRRRRST